MAKVILAPSLAGISGKVGNWVYRHQHGQTVVMEGYEPGKKNRETAAQRAGRDRFRAAQAYAAGVLADPLKRECYLRLARERKRPVNALLVANFLNSPTIEFVDLAGFRAEGVVRVVAADAIQVVGVSVRLQTATGGVIEVGAATPDHDVWVYRCPPLQLEQTTALEIVAVNRAGATGTKLFLTAG